MSRTLLASLALIAFPTAPALAQDFWIVDPQAAGADFADLPAAVAAAADGDVIHVRAGSYSATVLDGRSLTIVGVGPEAHVASLDVRNVPPGGWVLVRGLSSGGPSPEPALELEQNAGPVWIEDCELIAPWRTGATVVQSDAVTFVRTQIEGGNPAEEFSLFCAPGQVTGERGLLVDGSTVYVFDSTVVGGPGTRDCQDPLGQGVTGFNAPGGPGIELTSGCFLSLVGSSVTGGDGGDDTFDDVVCVGSPGGAGVLYVDAASVLHTKDSIVAGGPGGNQFTLFEPCTTGSDGPDVAGSGSQLQLPGAARSLEVSALASIVDGIDLTYTGLPGDIVFLLFSAKTSPFYATNCGAALLPNLSTLFIEPAGIVPSSGILYDFVPVSGPQGPLDAASLPMQGFFLGEGLSCHLSSPSAPSLKRCSLVFGGGVDCNGNDVLDECEILWELTPDCNGSLIPDSCDITSGASADCNGNGVPDECDIASGTSLDSNESGVPDECEGLGTWYVDDDAPADPAPGDPTVSDPAEDGTAQHPYDSVQEAIDHALSGDVIVIRPGTFTGPGNTELVMRGLPLRIRGDAGGQTILDGQGAERLFDLGSTAPAGTVLRDLTLRDGFASDEGGGLSINGPGSVALFRVRVESCEAPRGGGIAATSDLFGSPSISMLECELVGNAATGVGFGGGLYVTHGVQTVTVEVAESVFVSNTAAGSGGGAYLRWVDHQLRDLVFQGNDAAEEGGGLWIEPADSFGVLLERCRFEQNSLADSPAAVRGAGLFTRSTWLAQVRDCLFAGNDATQGEGGGIGVETGDSLWLYGCTLADNSAQRGGGVSAGTLVMHSSIAWGNVAPAGPQVALDGTAAITYSDLQGGVASVAGVVSTATAVLDADPLFVAPGLADYHLSPGSPCIDAGDPAYPTLPGELDLDGDPRVQNGRVDMGADETPAP